MENTIYLWNLQPPSDSAFDEEEMYLDKICPRCLELESECQCTYYDELEYKTKCYENRIKKANN